MKWTIPVLVYASLALGLLVFRHAWAALALFHLTIVLSLLLAKPGLRVRVLVTGRDCTWAVLCVLLSVVVGIALFLMWDRFGVAADVSTRLQVLGLNSSTWIPFIVYFSLVNPPVEEYFWRGYLGSSSPEPAASDFLYSGFHALILLDKVPPGMIVFSLAVLVMAGWFWRQVARSDEGLLAPVLGHMAADLAILVAVYLRVSP